MAEEDTEDQNEVEEEQEKTGGGKKLIILGGLVLVLVVGGFFAYKPIMNMISPPPEAEEAAEAEAEVDTSKPALFAPLNPPLLINFTDGAGQPHFLQVTLDVMSRDQAVIDEVKNHATVIRNALILMYGNVDYEFIQTREGKEQMLADARDEISRIIERETGMTGVEAVYFTALIIQ